jgi:hypothetical protein
MPSASYPQSAKPRATQNKPDTNNSQGAQSVAGMLQLVRDWHHKMVIRGLWPAKVFCIDPFNRMYHTLQQTGTLPPDDIQFLRNSVNCGKPWYIRRWEANHYPAEQGIAPIPPVPQPESYSFVSDSDDEY